MIKIEHMLATVEDRCVLTLHNTRRTEGMHVRLLHGQESEWQRRAQQMLSRENSEYNVT